MATSLLPPPSLRLPAGLAAASAGLLLGTDLLVSGLSARGVVCHPALLFLPYVLGVALGPAGLITLAVSWMSGQAKGPERREKWLAVIVALLVPAFVSWLL